MDTLPSAPVLVGASLGGVVTLIGLGEQLLPRARALVLVDVVPRMETAGVQEVIDFMSVSPGGFSSVEAAADSVARYLPHREQRSSADGLLKNLRLRDDDRYYWHWDPAFLEDRFDGSAGPARLVAATQAIDVPMLLVRGHQSDIVTEEVAQEFLRLVPQAQYADVADARHMVVGDRNDVFLAEVERFLERLG